MNYVKGEISSCCEVLYGLLDQDKIDRPIAAAIYTGMIHDTGVFQYSSTGSGDYADRGRTDENRI